jgi:hypothetical protein
MDLQYFKYKRNKTIISVNSVKMVIPLVLRFHFILQKLIFDYFFETRKSYFIFKGLRNSFCTSLQSTFSLGVNILYKVRLLLIDKNKDGYKIIEKGSKLIFKLGKSHDIIISTENIIKHILGRKAKSITMWSFRHKLLHKIISVLRGERSPEPYKGKGVIFKHELIRRKKIRKLRSVKNFKKKRRK